MKAEPPEGAVQRRLVKSGPRAPSRAGGPTRRARPVPLRRWRPPGRPRTCGRADGSRGWRLVEAVRVALVRTQEREHPAYALVEVDFVDQPDGLVVDMDVLGERPLD